MNKTIETGKKAGIKWSNLNIDPKQLEKGIKVEHEHKDLIDNNKTKAAKIAVAHLKEIPNYYDKLKTMEESASKKENKRKILGNLIKKV